MIGNQMEKLNFNQLNATDLNIPPLATVPSFWNSLDVVDFVDVVGVVPVAPVVGVVAEGDCTKRESINK
jgi:hypothetical protein